MKINSVFSSGALLLQNSKTEFRGIGTPNEKVTCSLYQGNKLIRKSEAVCSDDGKFTVRMQGEPASFEKYSIEFSCGNERNVIEDILFGELWLAAGQSNMEMANTIMENCQEFLDMASKYEIRYYKFTTPWDSFTNPPFERSYDTPGKWGSSRNKEEFAKASAAASAAMTVLAERFESEGKKVPVGFIDISIGGVMIEAFLPLEVIDGELKDLLIATGHYLPKDKRGAEYKDLFSANSVFYNQVTYPLNGVKMRGTLWYQGESNAGPRPVYRTYYKKAIEVFRREYKKLFAESPDSQFPFICSLLFPWIYGVNGDVRKGNVDEAFRDVAAEHPDEFFLFPIYDLPAKWSYFYDYHPIHPTNKYGVGERYGNLMLSAFYGEEGMKTSACFKKAVRKKGAIEVRFETFGKSLYCKGNVLHGFYIAGRNGTYIPADAEIISRTAVRVSSEYIDTPKDVCYQMADLENDGNLYCGDLPVVQFATENKKNIAVAIKPWLRADTDCQFRSGGTDEMNVFGYPVRFPSEGTALCYDPAYDAVRAVNTDGGTTCGFYVKSEKTMPLDLYNYASFNFTLYARPEVKASVKLTLRKGSKVSERICRASYKSEEGTGILECRIPFRISPDTVTEKMELIFDVSKLHFPTVAVGNMALVPKKY